MTGIKYIDLGGFDFHIDGTDNHVIKGIYDAIESTRKRIVLTNVKFDGIERNDMEVSVRTTGNSFILNQPTGVANRTFEVNSDDEVKLTVS